MLSVFIHTHSKIKSRIHVHNNKYRTIPWSHSNKLKIYMKWTGEVSDYSLRWFYGVVLRFYPFPVLFSLKPCSCFSIYLDFYFVAPTCVCVCVKTYNDKVHDVSWSIAKLILYRPLHFCNVILLTSTKKKGYFHVNFVGNNIQIVFSLFTAL